MFQIMSSQSSNTPASLYSSSQAIRIVNLDSYMSFPVQGLDVLYSEFRGSSVNQVPVLRLFGSIPTGEKICVHIHGVFPYIYIPYDGIQDANTFMYKIASCIDKAVNISLNQAASNMQHVYKITLVSGIPMYGYHTKEHQFFKIYLYNPLLVRKVTGLLMNESTLGSQYQPHEAHLPFTLQFMIDYNLHGMSNMILSKIKYRYDPNNIDDMNTNSEMFLPTSVGKISICQLEGDCLAEDIINRLEVSSGNIGANPGIAALWEDEKQRRRNKGLNSQIEHLLELARNNIPPTKSHMIYKQALADRLAVFSNEKNMVDKLNASVYPSETPDSSNIRNASMVDSHTLSSIDSNSCTSSELDETLVFAESSSLNITLDQDAQQLLQVLNELEENAKEIEEDSILIQVSEQNDQDADENEFDFSISLESVQTPVKVSLKKGCSDESDDDLLNTTLIPQLDGGFDDTVKESWNASIKLAESPKQEKAKRLKKFLYVKLKKKENDMPNLDTDFNIQTQINRIPNPTVLNKTRVIKRRTKPTEMQLKEMQARKMHLEEIQARKMQLEVRRFEFRIREMKRKDQLAAIMRKLHKKENKIILYLSRNGQAKFKIVSKSEVKALLPTEPVDINKTSKVNIISDIIVKMANFVDPTLHLTIEYPNHCCYLYNYSSRYLPEVTKIPKKICTATNKTKMENYIKKKISNKNGFKEDKCSILDLQNGCDRVFSSCTRTKVTEIIETDQKKEKPFIFSEKYLCDVKDAVLMENIRIKSDDDLLKMAENLKQELEMHMQILKTPTNIKYDNYQTTEHRLNVLNELTCFKCEDDFSDLVNEENNNIASNGVMFRSVDNCDIEVGWNLERLKNNNINQVEFVLKEGCDIVNGGNAKHQKRKKCEAAVGTRRSERIKDLLKKQCILSLDGTVDSESSEEEPSAQKRERRSRTPRINARYNALPISLQKSPKVLKSSGTAVNNLVSTVNTCEKTPPTIIKVTNNTIHEANVKRQLFVKNSEHVLQSTIIEEKLVCRHDSANDQKINIVPQNHESGTDTSNSSSVFSTESDKYYEMSFFVSQTNTALTTAEKYDKETSYIAREGCSKILTPQYSQSDSNKMVSSGSSKSEYLTPYQQPNLDIKQNLIIKPKVKAPTRSDVIKSLDLHKIPHVKFQTPFYSNVEDVTGNMEVGFNVLKINSNATVNLLEFESQFDSLNSIRNAMLEHLPSNIKLTKTNMNSVKLSYCKNRDCIVTPVKKPPDMKTIYAWIERKNQRICIPETHREKITIRLPTSPGDNNEDHEMELSLTLSPKSETTPIPSNSPTFRENYKKRKKQLLDRKRNSLTPSQERSINNSGQITGITVYNSLDKSVQNLKTARAIIEHQNLTVMVMELHIQTRGDFKPDPKYDSIRAIFYSVLNDVPEPNSKGRYCKGVIAVNSVPFTETSTVPILNGSGIDCDINYVDTEDDLLKEFLKLVDYWDPDIFAGYEIELLSWGYLIERGYGLNTNIKPLLSRTKEVRTRNDEDSTDLKLPGRIVLDVWRLMRHEISLQSYTFESIAWHILRKRFARYSFKDLSFWWDHRTQLYRYKTVKYYITRVVAVLELFDKLDFLGRTSELARLFGIQFFEVLSRGTQFRVESMMLRLAKPLNFIPVSPSVQQRAHMKAPEYIALVMEPESKLYNDPVIVLDFQSLYPSIIIAYNYCFTTCVGRVECLGKNGPFEFGATQLKVSRSRLRKLLEKNQLHFSPCGVGFVKKEIRDGILPRMLREILDTRLMVKNSMKENPNDKTLQKVLHNRQLGLKLIANVTFGYTSANFSGRMPAVELGDSVVSKARETLQRAIEMVDNTPEWGARVVYGDTDSLFVLIPGRTKEHAFEIGKKIAEAVTNDNPDPMKLKLEKVYQPCILQTKKRYVGYMYESPDQKEPVYQAKGIETVRRDGCPAVSKMLEKCLRILFETKDVSLVKKYVLKQFNKIVAGRVSIQDLTFAKEYRGASGYRPGACVPALELTRKWTSVDKRNEPRSGERVPYVIVNGPPGLPLIRLVRSPIDLIDDSSLKPNVEYYITRVIIPPLNRCFSLLGADMSLWYNQMPRRKIQYLPGSVSPRKKSTISQYFSTSSCASCEEQTQKGICEKCLGRPQITVVTLMEKMRKWERNLHSILMVCQTCTSSVSEVSCISLDCPIYYRRIQTTRDEHQTTYIRQLLSSSDLSF